MLHRIRQWVGRVTGALRKVRILELLQTVLLAALLMVALALGTFLLWTYPRHAANSLDEDATAIERRQVENDYRATGAQLFLGLGILVGIYLTYRRIRAVERQANTAEQGQITERFTVATEQLGRAGDENLAIRLGGIYALERIMRDSQYDFPTVQEVLGAFIREETLKPTSASVEAEEEKSNQRPRTDIQAALTALGRNPPKDPAAAKPIELTSAQLEGADLFNAHLKEAFLGGVNLARAALDGAILEGAYLEQAHLREACLEKANLRGADLERANLEGAYLSGANLSEANLREANLKEANLEKADLRRAHLEGTHLEDARGLEQQQINQAITDDKTMLPEGLVRTDS